MGSMPLVITDNLCQAMTMAHYNVPKLYSEYHKQDPREFAKVCFTAVVCAATIATTLGISGVLRFGTAFADGNVLSNFNNDFPEAGGNMSQVERYLTLFVYIIQSVNIICCFPLLFTPLRTAFLRLCGYKIEQLQHTTFVLVTAA